MAHELDRLSDDTGAVFSVRDTPWHREGTVLTNTPLAGGGAPVRRARQRLRLAHAPA